MSVLAILLIIGFLLLLALASHGHIFVALFHPHLAGALAIAAVVGLGLLFFVAKNSSVEQRAAFARQMAENARLQAEQLQQIADARARNGDHQGVIPPLAHGGTVVAESEESQSENRAPAEAKTEPKAPLFRDTPGKWRQVHYDPRRNPSVDKEGRLLPQSEQRSAEPPSWLDESPHRDGDTYFIAVKPDTHLSDANSRAEMLERKMVAAASAYIDDRLLQQPGATQAIDPETKFLPEFLQQFITDRCYYPTGEEAVRLGLNDRFRTEIEYRWKQSLSVDHVRQVATVGLVGFLALGIIYGYLRLLGPNRPPTKSANSDAQSALKVAEAPVVASSAVSSVEGAASHRAGEPV